MEKFIVDRIEGNTAVLECEDLTTVQADISALPENTEEGSVLIFDGSVYTLDKSDETVRRNRIIKKQQKIFKNR